MQHLWGEGTVGSEREGRIIEYDCPSIRFGQIEDWCYYFYYPKCPKVTCLECRGRGQCPRDIPLEAKVR